MKKSQTKGENTMKTPLEYTKNLKNHIITPQMLLDCIYSTNKRAKNWRVKEQEYRKTTLFSYRHTTVLFLFVLNVNDFIVTPNKKNVSSQSS